MLLKEEDIILNKGVNKIELHDQGEYFAVYAGKYDPIKRESNILYSSIRFKSITLAENHFYEIIGRAVSMCN